MITVYYTRFEAPLHPDTFSAHMAPFPAEMKDRLMKFRRWQDAHASLFGKLLLQKGINDFGKSCRFSNLKYSGYGRPFFENMPDFNISHSGEYVVCAFAQNGKIGIDIEEIKIVSLDDFENSFNEKEWQHIKASKDPYQTFFYYWSVKESILKADGRGINVPLKKIQLQKGIARLEDAKWYLKNIPFVDDYIVQIAATEMINEVSIKEVNFHK